MNKIYHWWAGLGWAEALSLMGLFYIVVLWWVIETWKVLHRPPRRWNRPLRQIGFPKD